MAGLRGFALYAWSRLRILSIALSRRLPHPPRLASGVAACSPLEGDLPAPQTGKLEPGPIGARFFVWRRSDSDAARPRECSAHARDIIRKIDDLLVVERRHHVRHRSV